VLVLFETVEIEL